MASLWRYEHLSIYEWSGHNAVQRAEDEYSGTNEQDLAFSRESQSSHTADCRKLIVVRQSILSVEVNMTAYETKNADKASIPVASESQQALCRVCGQPSEESICPTCANKIRGEAVANTVGEAPKARSKPGRRKAK